MSQSESAGSARSKAQMLILILVSGGHLVEMDFDRWWRKSVNIEYFLVDSGFSFLHILNCREPLLYIFWTTSQWRKLTNSKWSLSVQSTKSTIVKQARSQSLPGGRYLHRELRQVRRGHWEQQEGCREHWEQQEVERGMRGGDRSSRWEQCGGGHVRRGNREGGHGGLYQYQGHPWEDYHAPHCVLLWSALCIFSD